MRTSPRNSGITYLKRQLRLSRCRLRPVATVVRIAATDLFSRLALRQSPTCHLALGGYLPLSLLVEAVHPARRDADAGHRRNKRYAAGGSRSSVRRGRLQQHIVVVNGHAGLLPLPHARARPYSGVAKCRVTVTQNIRSRGSGQRLSSRRDRRTAYPPRPQPGLSLRTLRLWEGFNAKTPCGGALTLRDRRAKP